MAPTRHHRSRAVPAPPSSSGRAAPPRALRRLGLVWILGLALASACGGEESPGGLDTGRGVLVIAIDGLRADRLSGLGHHRPTTPVFDELMAGGVTFTSAYSAAPAMLPAHVSLFTGCAPDTARWITPREGFENSMEDMWRIPEQAPCVAAEFLGAGFATAAFVDHGNLGRASRFDRGFQRFDVTEPVPGEIRETSGIDFIGDAFLGWVGALPRSKPWYAYLHLHDLERTWRHPDPAWESFFQPEEDEGNIPPVGQTDSVFFAVPRSRWRGGNRTLGDLEARYDGHLRRLDAEVARILDDLGTHGRLADTTVVVVGTHGVQFGEGGLFLRAGRYTDADVRVPWILSSPRLASAAGRRVEHVVSTLDLAPTILELNGLEVPRGMHGSSHVPHLRDGEDVSGPELAFVTCGLLEGGAVIGPRWTMEFPEPWRVFDDSLLRGWYGDGIERGVESRRFFFYDRTRDPYWPVRDESVPPEARQLVDVGARWFESVDMTRRVLNHRGIFDPVPPGTIERLQADGFLGDWE